MNLNYLDEFLDHKLLVFVEKGSSPEIVGMLKEFSDIVNADYASGDKIYEMYLENDKYLHCRIRKNREKSITYSNGSYDCFDDYRAMPCVTIQQFLDSIVTVNITSDELNDLFKTE